MARQRVSSLMYRALLSSTHSLSHGRSNNSHHLRKAICRYSTAAVNEEPTIIPPVQVKYTQLLINGQFEDSASGKKFKTIDPRTGNVIAEVAEGDAEDINRAVAAARKAFYEGPWPRMTAYERSKILFKFADLVEKHTDEIAALETWDNGKPFEQAAKIELPMCVRIMRYYAGTSARRTVAVVVL